MLSNRYYIIFSLSSDDKNYSGGARCNILYIVITWEYLKSAIMLPIDANRLLKINIGAFSWQTIKTLCSNNLPKPFTQFTHALTWTA